MDIDKIKQRILDLAIRGKLVSQDPNDEPASVLIEKIKAEKEKMIKEGKIKPSKDDSYIYKASDNCYYENIPNGWTLVKLKELISLKSGMDLMLSEINTNSVGIPYLTGASCFTNNGLLINRWTNAPKNISHKNDLLITVKGTIGELAFNNIGEVHIARQIMALTINEEIEQKFIFYFLLVNKERMIQKNASLIPGIKRDDILNLEIALPPKEEQKRIIAKIDELLYFVKKIKNELKAMCDLSIAVKRKILDFFFGENSSYKSYYEKDLYKLVKLSQICSLYTGDSINKEIKNEKYKCHTAGVPYIATKDIDTKHSINYQNGVFIPSPELCQFSIAPKKSILLCIEGGSAGKKIAITDMDVCFGNKLCCFVSNNNILSSYLFYYLQSSVFKKSFTTNISGLIGGVGINKLRNIELFLPPKEKQLQIVEIIKKSFDIIDKIY